MNDDANILSSIPGEHIARAALKLSDAADAPDGPHHVDIWYGGRHIRAHLQAISLQAV